MDIQRATDKNEPLAFRYWPLEAKEEYWESDLDTEEKVEILFDYAQILEVGITKKGWNYLIERYGYETLFKIDKKSGWIDSESLEEFKSWVEYYMNLC